MRIKIYMSVFSLINSLYLYSFCIFMLTYFMTFIMHKFSPLSKLFNLECLLNNGKYVSRKQRNQTLWLSSTTISHLYQQWNTSHKFEDKCVSILPMYLGEKSYFFSQIFSNTKQKRKKNSSPESLDYVFL